MIRLIQQGGFFYLSTPIGRECVEFNANWFFDPRKIVGIAQDSGLTLTKLTVLASGNGPEESAFDDVTLSDLAAQEYSLGIFVFVKKNGYEKPVAVRALKIKRIMMKS